MRKAWVILLIWGCACDDGTTLRIDVIADYPRFELDAVEAGIVQDGELSLVRVSPPPEDLIRGARLTALSVEPGAHEVVARLIARNGREILQTRRLLVDVKEGSNAATVVFTSSCQHVECDSPDRPECVGGQCVTATCSPETPDECMGCEQDSDCESQSECAVARCLSGLCFQVADDFQCADDESCSTAGCVVDPSVDVDAGVDAEATDASPDNGAGSGTLHVRVEGLGQVNSPLGTCGPDESCNWSLDGSDMLQVEAVTGGEPFVGWVDFADEHCHDVSGLTCTFAPEAGMELGALFGASPRQLRTISLTDGGGGPMPACNFPSGLLVVDDGFLLSCGDDAVILHIAADGETTEYAGTRVATHMDGIRDMGAAFVRPEGMTIDDDAVIYVADAGAHRVRAIALDGMVSTYAGNGSAEQIEGPLLTAALQSVSTVSFSPAENRIWARSLFEVFLLDAAGATLLLPRLFSSRSIAANPAGGGLQSNADGIYAVQQGEGASPLHLRPCDRQNEPVIADIAVARDGTIMERTTLPGDRLYYCLIDPDGTQHWPFVPGDPADGTLDAGRVSSFRGGPMAFGPDGSFALFYAESEPVLRILETP